MRTNALVLWVIMLTGIAAAPLAFGGGEGGVPSGVQSITLSAALIGCKLTAKADDRGELSELQIKRDGKITVHSLGDDTVYDSNFAEAENNPLSEFDFSKGEF